MTWCSLAYNILLSFSKRHLPLLAPSHLKCQIKSEGHSMKISHSLQCNMFWPGQAGLNISATCQERQFKVHWTALDNITPWMTAISIVWEVSTAYLKTFAATTHCIPPSLCLKGQQNPTGVYSLKCYSALYNSRTCFMILILTEEEATISQKIHHHTWDQRRALFRAPLERYKTGL